MRHVHVSICIQLPHTNVADLSYGAGGEPSGVTLGKVDADSESVEVKISASVVQRARARHDTAAQKARKAPPGSAGGDDAEPTAFSLTAILY